MSLKNANLDKGLLDIASKIKDVENVDDILKSVKSINNLDDLAKTLSLGKITDKKLLGEIVRNADFDFVDDVSDLTNAMDAFDGSRKGVDGLTTSFKNLGKEIGGLLKSLATNPMTYIIAAMVAAKVAIDNYYEKYDKLVTAAEESQSAYASTASELETLNTEITSTSDKIAQLEAQDTLSITDEAELERLKNQNLELERQYNLKQQLAEEQSKTAVTDAMAALSLERTQDISQKTGTQSSSRHDFGSTVEYVSTDIVTAAQNEIVALSKLKEERNKLLNDDIANETQTLDFERIDAEISRYETEIASHIDSLSVLRENFIDQTTGMVKESLTTEELDMFNALTAIIDDFNNIDLSPAEKSFKKIENFFDSPDKNYLKNYLTEATKEGMSASVAIERLGIDLESAGLDAQMLNEYFRAIRDSAEETKDTVHDYSATLSDIESAGASADQDAGWSTISEAYQEAKELLKEGKTGTDNFQTMASFLNPEDVKKFAEKGGKYAADAYQKAFEAVTKTANRWFGEDETKSMENFVNDFKKKGLFDVETDDMGLWDIETNFETTAEAANKFGISIEAVETMLEALRAYGYEFEGITFSADALSEYTSYVEGIQEIHDNLEKSDFKDRLTKILDDNDLNYFEENIEELSPEIVAEIKFEYDLAQIDLEIQKLQEKLASTGYSDAISNAELISSNEYRSNIWQDERTGIKKDKGYSGLDTTISTMQSNLVGKSGEELASLQRQIIAVQELRTAFENAYDVAEQKGETLDWEQYINSDQAKAEVQNLSDNLKVPIEDFEELFNKEFATDTHLKMEIGTSLSKEKVEEELENLSAGSTIEFTADLDGVATQVQAIKNEDGTITYTLVEDGEEIDLNKEGTVIYRKAGQEPPDPKQTFVQYLMGGQAQPVPKDADVNYVYGDQEDPKDRIAFVTYRTRAGGGAQQLYGTAHVDGINNNIPYNVLDDKKYRTKNSHDALVGELGSEILVHGNTWEIIGENGAEFRHIPANSVVFNHKQTEELLSQGFTNSRGKARMYGTAHLEGTAYRLGNVNRVTSSDASKKATVRTSDKTTKSVESAIDAISKWFDWIEVRLARLGRDSENAEKAIERATSLSSTLTATNKAITAVNKEQAAANKGAKKYLKAAQTVAKNTGLSASLQKKVQNGTIDISKYGETTQKKISEYQNYYEKYLACLDQVADLEDQAIDLALSRLDSINEYYDALKSVDQSVIDLNDAKMEYRAAKGYSATNSIQESLLKSSLAEAKDVKSSAYSNMVKYESEFNSQVKKGNLKKGSVEYNERLAELNNLKAVYYEASTAVLEHADALREIKYTKLNNAIDKFSRAADRLQNTVDLAEARDENVSESTYKNQITNNNNEINKQYELREEKVKEREKYAVGSEKYQELSQEISDIDSEITNLLIENETLKDKIIENRFAPLEQGIQDLQNVRTEFDDLRELMNEESFFDIDTGEFTEEGIANIYLLEQGMIAAKQQIADYTEGLEKLEENYRNGNISQEEFNEKSEEYRQGIRDATKDVKSYSDTLVDLYLTQMKKENEALQEVIDKRKEALQRKEEYYNYDKNIRNQTKDINLLKAQAAALEGV